MNGLNTILESLTELLARMDQAYAQTADRFGFQCRGCRDNCCETQFHHHTLVEYLYLKQGLAELPRTQQREIVEKAADVQRQVAALQNPDAVTRIMCPLNSGGRCRLYAHRPMICRLHGVPHQLMRPDGRLQTGPGCADFEQRCGNPRTGLLDRTPLYHELARLERDARQQVGYLQKVKLTVADMVIVDLL